jgi:eukaryotic-like serine/threonine-protein kinase
MVDKEPDNDQTRTHVALTKGAMVQRYRIIDRIGAGGMGEVYLAEDTELERRVALKFLPASMAQDSDLRARFTREAQATAKLNHPNVVTIYEVSEQFGRPFIAMELVEGQTLSELSKSNKLDVDRIIEIAIQLCDGLGAAHEKEVIHRDIKPSNIVVDSHGRPKILDFGLAAIQGGDNLTKTGSTLGTIRYMSPEQALGQEVDRRSDLFSLGVLLYEMIAGRTPFEQDNEAATLRSIINDNPEPLARYKADVPDELQRTVSKLLEKQTSLRYQNAEGVTSDLKRLIAPSGSTIIATPAKSKSRMPVIISSLVVLSALVVGAIKFWPSNAADTNDPTKPKRVAVLPFENLGSPDDEYFADGITEAITSRLARVGDLRVISRTSAMQYKNSDLSLGEIGSELGVEYVLEGTILWDKTGDTDRVRVTPQLIKVADDFHIWADEYDGPLTQIFALQAKIASAIVKELNVALLNPQNHNSIEIPTKNIEAYQAYLRGQELTRTDYKLESFKKAVKMFELSVSLDPDFALGYAALSEARSSQYHSGGDRSDSAREITKAAAEKALLLSPNLPEANVALGTYHYYYYRDYEKALEYYNLAREKMGNDAHVIRSIATIRKRQGKFEEAIELYKQSFELDPKQFMDLAEISSCLFAIGKVEEAITYLDKAISIKPDFTWVYDVKARYLYHLEGRLDEARKVLESAPEFSASPWITLYTMERAFDSALALAISLPEISGNQYVIALREFMIGGMYGYKADTALAYSHFEKALVYFDSVITKSPDDYRFYPIRAILHAVFKNREKALSDLETYGEFPVVKKDVFLRNFNISAHMDVLLLLGDFDACLEKMDEALESYVVYPPYIRIRPLYDPIRNYPGFEELLQKYEQKK